MTNGPWFFAFRAEQNSVEVEYALPLELEAPREAVGEFFQPIREQLRGEVGELPALGAEATTLRSLENTLCSLKMLADVQRRAEQLVEEEKVMEAILLTTTHWRAVDGEGAQVLSLCASRSTRDRAPAAAIVLAGLCGPLAWLPGVLIGNEVIMRRVDGYGALPKKKTEGGSGWGLAKAALQHHIVRMLYDQPRAVKLREVYEIQEGLTAEELQEHLKQGSEDLCVSGCLEL